jgi:hypothetical protein
LRIINNLPDFLSLSKTKSRRDESMVEKPVN